MNHSLFIVLTAALVTVLLRFIPFIAFQNRALPPIVLYLGEVLPFAIMGMLVVYCLKSTSFSSPTFGIPEIVSVLLTVLLHKWRHNTLLSILGGTICYVVFVQFIFA